MKWKVFLWLAAVFFAGRAVLADAPATQPSADDTPAPAEMAPTYLKVGKDLRLRLSLVRRTLDELTLDAATRQQADQLVDSCKADLQYLIGEIEAGRMPPVQRVMAIPGNLRAARAKLMQIIGPDQGQLLDEKLQSLRGEARKDIGQLRQGLEDLKCPPNQIKDYNTILDEADKGVESLPDTEETGDDYARDRAKMNDLLAKTHDRLMQVLSADQQAGLGEHFSQLVNGAATEPS